MNKTSIQKELLYLGMKPSIKGFEYTATAIELYEANMKITDLYKRVADEYKTTSSRVERAIRHSKETMLNNDIEGFENKINTRYVINVSIKNKITNGDFIASMNFAIQNMEYTGGGNGR